MNSITYIISPKDDGKFLRDILRRNLKISSSLLTKLKKSDGIRLNGISATVNTIVRTNDSLLIILPSESSESILPVNIPLDIVYEDDYLIIINKPKDMPTHPSIGNHDNTVGNACMYYYRNTDFVFRPLNRLDRDTTGLMVISKDARTAAIMSEQMKNNSFKKTYVAITNGIPTPCEGIINSPIGRCNDSIIKREVRADGQEAITHYSVLKTSGNHALVELQLHTGRTHQIRVHMSSIGTPLLYDYLYGEEIPGETVYLHCKKIRFFHPISGEPMEISVREKFPIFD